MQVELVKRLLELNRTFYSAFARDFSETRSSERMNMAPIMPYLAGGGKLLDVGCGNGRLAERLGLEGYRLDYTGVDVASKLIEVASASRMRSIKARFVEADVTAPGWQESVFGGAPFDLALLLAVLHHIPGTTARQKLISDLYGLLAPHARLVMSNWQFMQNERLRTKIVPWSIVGIEKEGLEPGDYLLDWKRGGTGYRYVHQFSETEIDELATSTGFAVEAQFRSDNDLNLYTVLRRA